MADAFPTYLGQIQGAGAQDALWLMEFSGEVLTAFEVTVHLRDKIRTRSITGAKSAQFPATFRTNTRYHVPGTEILGQVIENNEVVISLDDLAISDTFVSQLDEMKNQYDVRAIHAVEHGRAHALFYDRIVSNVLVKSARNSTELFQGDGAGTQVTDTTDLSGSSDFTASGADLISGINLAKQKMEENDVPIETMPLWALFKPAQWYLIANSDHNLNRLYNPEGGSTAKQVLRTVSDIQIVKSNATLFGFNVTKFNSTSNATGVVSSAAEGTIGGGIAGTNYPTTGLPKYGPIQAGYPSKYQSDQRATAGLVWCEPAAGMLNLMGLSMETYWDVRRQGTLMIAKQALGADLLRSKCCVELQANSLKS